MARLEPARPFRDNGLTVAPFLTVDLEAGAPITTTTEQLSIYTKETRWSRPTTLRMAVTRTRKVARVV